MTKHSTRVQGERWTIKVCPEHGIQEGGKLRRDLTERCPGHPIIGGACNETLEPVEVIPSSTIESVIEELEDRAAEAERDAGSSVEARQYESDAAYASGLSEAADLLRTSISQEGENG